MVDKMVDIEIFSQIDIQKIKQIAIEAGIEIMKIYKSDFDVQYKSDNSPLTQADRAADKIICENLKKLYPDIKIISEEGEEIEYKERKNLQYYWCVDPLDGTKEFIQKNGEFTVNIALIYKDTPVLGVVYAPVIGELYYAKKGSGAFLDNINEFYQIKSTIKLPINNIANNNIKNKLNIIVSKSHPSPETQNFIDELSKNNKIFTISKGSSLKFCILASGGADIYPRFSPTMEWDSAAGDAIVREVGKITYQYATGKPLVYNKENLLNPWFIAT